MNTFWIGMAVGAGTGAVLAVVGLVLFVGVAVRRVALKMTGEMKGIGFIPGELKEASCNCSRNDKSFTCPEIGIAMTDSVCDRTRQLAPALCANCLIPVGAAQ